MERLGQKYGLDVAGVEVIAEKGTQVLSVHLVAERSGDGARLSMFREELWGGVVPRINSDSGSVGLGYLDVKDLSGNQLLFEVSDSMIGWTNAHSETDYPPAE